MLRPFLGRLCEAAHDQRRQSGRNVHTRAVDGFRVARQLRGHRLLRRCFTERCFAGEQLIGQQADGVDVHSVVGRRVASQLFRRHVRGRPDRHAACGHSNGRHRCGNGLGDAKVGHHGVAAAAQHVARLDVAVNHAPRMGIGERVQDVVQYPGDLFRGKTVLRTALVNGVP